MLEDTTTTQTDAPSDHVADNDVPEAVAVAFDAVFNGDRNQREREQQRDELIQEGLETEDGNAPADEQTIRPDSSGDETAEPADEAVESDEPAADGEATKVAPLDPYLRFIGTNSGLTVEQIDKIYAADPDTTVALLNNQAEQFTALSRQYVGGVGSPVAPGTQQTQQNPAQLMTAAPGWDAFMGKLADYTEANGEDFGQMAKLINDELVKPLREMQAANIAREQTLIRQEAVSGFESIRKDFADFYGPENGTLSPGQSQARSTVAQIADQIRAGAKAQGRDVAVSEALKRAHSIVTHDMRQQAARKEIVASVQKRAKSATAKPTQRVTRPTGEKSEKAAAAAAQAKMLEIGMD